MIQSLGNLSNNDLRLNQKPQVDNILEGDFEQVLRESNFLEHQRQIGEQQANGKELKIGETKSDRAFREQLEKITGKKQDLAKNKLTKDDYLNLMVTELQNQDPTKPKDNQEMATQMAQFNSVEQLMSLNEKMDKIYLVQQELKGQKLTEYMGKQVDIDGNQLKIKGHKLQGTAAFNLGQFADFVNIQIKNTKGDCVKTFYLNACDAGSHTIDWDAKNEKGMSVADGDYVFEVHAAQHDGKDIAVKPFYRTQVLGVQQMGGHPQLETPFGAVDLNHILAVRQSA